MNSFNGSTNAKNNTTGGAHQITSGELIHTMTGLEQFGHQLFTGPDALQVKPRSAKPSSKAPEIHNAKGRALVKTMQALEEFGFHIFTAAGA